MRRDHGGLLGEDVPGRARGAAVMCQRYVPRPLPLAFADGVCELHELPQQDALGVGALAPGCSRAWPDLDPQDPQFGSLFSQPEPKLVTQLCLPATP